MVLRGSGTRVFSSLWPPVAPCAALKSPLAADWIPYKKHFRRTGGLDLKAWCLDAWMLAGLKDLRRWLIDGRRGLEGLRT